jgi:long-chain acyl-CoA synthetase
MNISKETIHAIFKKAFAEKPKKPFMVLSKETITYGDLKSQMGRYSNFFNKQGIGQGSRVLFSSFDEGFISIFYLSLLANGITAIFIDPESGKERAKSIINHTKVSYSFLDQQLINDWQIEGSSDLIVIPLFKNETGNKQGSLLRKKDFKIFVIQSFAKEMSETEFNGIRNIGDDAYILFTSGTTSAPKGVRISYRALFSHLATLSNVYQLNDQSRIFNNLIMSHTDGMTQGPMLALYNCATVFRPFPFSIQRIEDIFDTLYKEKITHWVVVPTMLGIIYQLKKNDTDTLATGYFKFLISCAGKLEQQLWEKFEEKFRTIIINGYGLTETVTGGLFAGPDVDSHVIGTIGKPVDCDAIIADENGNQLPPNTQGEIWMKGSMLMSGYLDAPNADKEVFSGEWFKTGDLGYIGDDGCFRITGRKKLIIISGGLNISPEEVTEVLVTHPAIETAVTFGMDDELWGEIVASAVVAKNNYPVSTDEIISFCRKNLEERKVPSKIFFIDEIPMGRSGKVIIPKIKEIVAATTTSFEPNNNTIPIFFEIVSKCLQVPIDQIKMEINANDTPEWDSIAHLMLIAEMERKYNITFTPIEVMNINTVSELYQTIEDKRK